MRIKVRRSKHSSNHRPDGHYNWKVEDPLYGITLVYRSHARAMIEADRLARTGSVHAAGLRGAYGAVHD